jgi:hypothetical protein
MNIIKLLPGRTPPHSGSDPLLDPSLLLLLSDPGQFPDYWIPIPYRTNFYRDGGYHDEIDTLTQAFLLLTLSDPGQFPKDVRWIPAFAGTTIVILFI